ncbi:peptidoglycan DD-metalloendopeptidase family protein [Segeticoccus rhizosphaerae]|uniref:peptidoglycan DD-metalloendopeptidase family protein n=1 Tax=Segeticoccus rhizosphaerae TaxID=1104777 RepID=UPI0010C0FBB1|nr:peptidoglycan DD-metalloendopeptidase family protein [Ornithinicoccus soli]
MKKVAILGLLVAPVLLVPLAAVLLLATIATPAISQELKTLACGGPTVATGTWRPPTNQKYTITSGFGHRASPGGIGSTYHEGVDLAMLPVPGPVLAASAGTVKTAGPRSGLGNAVVLDHGSGIETTYGHLVRIDAAITPGAPVAMGQQLGVEGSTGTSTGAHLHFGVNDHGTNIDPAVFMARHGAPLAGRAVAPTPSLDTSFQQWLPADGEGGIGFPLPAPGRPRQNSRHTPALPIPAPVKGYYAAAASRYKIPWTLLAGIGMEETGHGRNNHTSSAGAQGLMQFMPATWASYGVDGDGDGRADIHNDADSVMSAANYLTAAGATKGPEGVRRALFAYNHAQWYVGDVLWYAQAYGGGTVAGDPTDCGPGTGAGNPTLTPLASGRVTTVLSWAHSQLGKPYRLGANGPDRWDCSSYTQAAFRQIGVTMPRTAQSQRDWLAAGNGHRVRPDRARPGDLIFYDSYLGPNVAGHVEIVDDPARHQAIGAQNPRVGVTTTDYTHAQGTKALFEIWRVGNISDTPTKAGPP